MSGVPVKRIRVLIIDDSVIYRSQIRSALEQVEWIEVVGVAADGRIGIEKIKSTKPDLITLDLEMPVLNGIETLKELKQLGLQPKVIVFSSTSQTGAQQTLDALNEGALDFVPKPNGEDQTSLYDRLVPRIKQLFPEAKESAFASARKTNFDWEKFSPSAVLIGSSTGGPATLEKIFSTLKGPYRIPVFIVQHMPPVFTASLAARLERLTGVPAAEGKNGEVVTENRIYVAPGNFHMRLKKDGTSLRVTLDQGPLENSIRPAVDPLFTSAAPIYGRKALGIILTGMGRDGLVGCKELRSASAPVLIQSKETCVVFGMPGAVFEAEAYDAIKDPDQISEALRVYLSPLSTMRRVGNG